MLKGRLYIDGKDAYTTWGVYIEQDGWNNIIAFPPLKAVPANDWHEESGIEVDLHAPRLSAYEVKLQFTIENAKPNYAPFLAKLYDGAYHTFDNRALERSHRLRVTDVSSVTLTSNIAAVECSLTDDFPMQGYVYQVPRSTLATDSAYTLDGRPLTDYGIQVLQGTQQELMRPASTKTNLCRDMAAQHGVSYDGQRVTRKARDVKLYCLMRTKTLAELWRNYDALLYDLIRPNPRNLHTEYSGTKTCYYKNCTIQAFYAKPEPWLQFTLTLTLIN